MSRCLSCGGHRSETDGPMHVACIVELFGVTELPRLDVELGKLHTLALSMVGQVSISGAQRKLSVDVDTERCTLHVSTARGRFLLKPQAGTFPDLPENEWVTQRLAALAGIRVAPSGLVSLRDGSLAYVTRRFDRRSDGTKRAMEDFCQLAEQPPGEKYEGTAERCGKLLRRFASEPLIELRELYRVFVFSWWVGNGDLHLKNLAVLRDDDGRIVLSPTFDQLNTRLVIPGDVLALTVDGKRDRLKRDSWERLAANFGIGERAALRVREEIAASLPRAVELVRASPLPVESQDAYVDLLHERLPA